MTSNPAKSRKPNVRKLAMTAMLGATATVLMFISISVPLMPSFIKLDLSELPALIASFSLGPASGIGVCLLKNLLNLPFSQTGGVGELSNFLLGAAFVLPAGLVYRKLHSRRGALLGALSGAVTMGLISFLTNYFLVYPLYTAFMPMETILAAYRAIYPGIKNLAHALWMFNVPFTAIKGLISLGITLLIYKKLSPLLQGRQR